MDNIQNKITFQFISEPTDVNFGGKVHGGAVMKWIDQTAFACASSWAEGYCVTIYAGGIRFYKPILIGNLVKVTAKVIYTGSTSIHIAVDVYSRKISEYEFNKTTHCVIVFVSVDDDGKPKPVRKWEPITEKEKHMEHYAQKLIQLRKDIEVEMLPFLKEYL
jgi:acyl-CoA hydrolase